MTAPSDRVALVTGSARGIGVGIVDRLLRDGFRVAVVDLDADAVDERVAVWQGRGHAVVGVAADVCDRDAVRAAVSAVTEALGPVDVVVNNAGVWTFQPFASSEPAQWMRDINVNLVGTLTVTREVLPGMLARGHGRVINIVSDSGRVGELNVAAYAAAKAGVMGFARALAKEVGRDGVTVNNVSLSTTLTPGAHDTYDEAQLAKMTRRYPVGRLGRPADAAGAVAYFASGDAEWVTGQTLSVNGGYAML